MQAPSPPIIVKIVETNEISGLGDVMLEAIGLTGVISVGAVLFGLVLAVVIIGYRKIQARLHPDEDAHHGAGGILRCYAGEKVAGAHFERLWILG